MGIAAFLAFFPFFAPILGLFDIFDLIGFDFGAWIDKFNTNVSSFFGWLQQIIP